MLAFDINYSFVNSFALKEAVTRYVHSNLLLNFDTIGYALDDSLYSETNLYSEYILTKLEAEIHKNDFVRLCFVSILYYDPTYVFASSTAILNKELGKNYLKRLICDVLLEVLYSSFYNDYKKEANQNLISFNTPTFSIPDYNDKFTYKFDSLNLLPFFFQYPPELFFQKQKLENIFDSFFFDFGIEVKPFKWIEEFDAAETEKWSIIGGSIIPKWANTFFQYVEDKFNIIINNKQAPELSLKQAGDLMIGKVVISPLEIIKLVEYYSKIIKNEVVFSLKDAIDKAIIPGELKSKGFPIFLSNDLSSYLKLIFENIFMSGRLNALCLPVTGNDALEALIQSSTINQKAIEFKFFYSGTNLYLADKKKEGQPKLPAVSSKFKSIVYSFEYHNDKDNVDYQMTRYSLPIANSKIVFELDGFFSKSYTTSAEIFTTFNFQKYLDIIKGEILNSEEYFQFMNEVLNVPYLKQLSCIYQNMNQEYLLMHGTSNMAIKYQQFKNSDKLFDSLLTVMKNFDNFKEP